MDNSQANYSLLIHLILFVSCLLSVIASFFTFYIYYKYRQLSQNYPARLILLLSFSDGVHWGEFVINLGSKFFGPLSFQEQNEGYCIFSCIYRCFWIIFNLCCVFMIGFALFFEMVIYRRAEKLEKWGYVVSVILSTILAFLPYALGKYVPLDPYQCWIQDNHLNFIIFYAPVSIVVVADFIFIFFVIRLLKSLHVYSVSRSIILKFLMFPVILILSWIFGFIRMLGDIDNIVLDGFMYSLMPIQGILNPFIYGSIFTIVKEEVLGINNKRTASINKPSMIEVNPTIIKRITYDDLVSLRKEVFQNSNEAFIKSKAEQNGMSKNSTQESSMMN